MPIRAARIEDIPALVAFGQHMHAITRFRSQPYNAVKVAFNFSELITKGQGKYAFFVAESNAQDQPPRLVGGLIGVMEQQIFTDGWTASVMHIDVAPQARMGGWGVRLLRAFEQWAKNRNAIEISFGINSEDNMQRIGQFATKMGYRKVGENYVRSTA